MTATNALLAALAAKALDGTYVVASFATPPDTIGSTPAFVLGIHHGTITVATGEWWHYIIPGHLLCENSGGPERTDALLNDALDAVAASFRSGTSIGGTAVQALITDWQAGQTYQIGDAEYSGIDLTLDVRVSLPTAAHTA